MQIYCPNNFIACWEYSTNHFNNPSYLYVNAIILRIGFLRFSLAKLPMKAAVRQQCSIDLTRDKDYFLIIFLS